MNHRERRETWRSPKRLGRIATPIVLAMVNGPGSMVEWSVWAVVGGPVSADHGIRVAATRRMKAKNIEDVVVYKEAVVAEDEVSTILERSIFGKDLNLKGQLDRSSSRVAPLKVLAN